MKLKSSTALLVVLVIALVTLLVTAIISPDAIVYLFLGHTVMESIGSMI